MTAISADAAQGSKVTPPNRMNDLQFHHQRQKRGSAGVWISFGAASLGLTMIRGLNEAPWELHFFALLISAVAVMPMARWAQGDRRSMPMFEIINILYLIYYITPAYFQANSVVLFSKEYLFDWAATQDAYLWVFGGIIFLNIGHALGGRIKLSGGKWVRPKLPQKSVPQIATGLIVFGLMVLLAEQMYLLPYGRIFSVGKMLAQSQMYIGLALLGLHVYSEKTPNRFWETVLFAGVGFSAILGLSSAMLEMGLLPGVIYFFVRWIGRRRFPLFLATVGVLVFVGLSGVKIEHRSNQYYFGGGEVLSGSTGWIGLAVDRFSYMLTDAPKEYRQKYWDIATLRFDYLHPLQHVMSMTPEKIPRYGGETYYYLFLGWIPRMIWAGKPTAQEANIRYAIDYDLLGMEQLDSTMMGIGQLTEAYVNFGLIGFLLTMSMHGIFYRLLGRRLDDPRSIAARAVYMVVMIFFFNGIGSATAACIYYAIYLGLGSLIILRLSSQLFGGVASNRQMQT